MSKMYFIQIEYAFTLIKYLSNIVINKLLLLFNTIKNLHLSLWIL